MWIDVVADRPKTLFAPTNAAFEALPAGVLDAILANQDEIGKLINTHTASGTFYSRGLVSGPIPVFSGSNLDLVVSPSKFDLHAMKSLKANRSYLNQTCKTNLITEKKKMS